MASHTFVRPPVADDPWHRRVVEAAYVVTVCVADLVRSAVEDAAYRIRH